MRPGLTRDLAAWVAGLRHADLPAAARWAVRLALLDTLAVGRFGMDEPPGRIARAWALRGNALGFDRSGRASLWGDAAPSLRAADAAFVNGIAAHAFDYDDYVAKLHPGAVVVPAALALAEIRDADGAALETAVAAGYEVMIRAGRALDPNAARLRGWHLTGVCGPLGAAAACAVLLGLSEEAAAWALGLAGSSGFGLFAFNADGAMSKRFHPGNAARAGVTAAELAALGFTGPTQLFEAEDGGFLRAFSDAPRPEALLDGLGSRWALAETRFKPYPCCGSAHAYVDAALDLRARLGGPPGPRQGVRAGICRVVDLQCGYDYRPGTALNAQMSLRYCMAAALLDGRLLPEQFADERLADPRILDLAARIAFVPDADLEASYPQVYAAWVEIDRAEGGVERAVAPDASGAPANPQRDAALTRKFFGLMQGRLPAPAADRLHAAALDLPSARSRDLVALLAAPAAA